MDVDADGLYCIRSVYYEDRIREAAVLHRILRAEEKTAGPQSAYKDTVVELLKRRNMLLARRLVVAQRRLMARIANHK